MAHWFNTIWAQSGDKVAIPETTDPNGYVSIEAGYPADYERVKGTDPLAKSPTREDMNEILYLITGAIQQYQKYGFPDYIDAVTNGGTPYAYAINSIVRFTDGKNYQNTVAANTNAPDVSGWIETDLSLYATIAQLSIYSTIAQSFAQSQAYVDVTASRTLGTTYTNNTTKPILISVSVGNGLATGYIAITVSSIEIFRTGTYADNGGGGTAIVPAGETYSVASNSALAKWVELR